MARSLTDLSVEGMEEVNRLEIDRREEKEWLYAIKERKVMKMDTDWQPSWIINVEKQIDHIAFVPMIEITLVLKNVFVRIEIERGKVVESFMVEEIRENVVVVSKNSENLMNEIVIIYETGQLWKIHIIERKVKWLKINQFNFADIVYSIKLDQKEFKNKKNYIGISTSRMTGVIDLENQENNHLLRSIGWFSNYILDYNSWIHGGISLHHNFNEEYAFYYSNGKEILIIGWFIIKTKYIENLKIKKFENGKNSLIVDWNYKINSINQNRIYLISSDNLIFINNFGHYQVTDLRINNNKIVQDTIFKVFNNINIFK